MDGPINLDVFVVLRVGPSLSSKHAQSSFRTSHRRALIYQEVIVGPDVDVGGDVKVSCYPNYIKEGDPSNVTTIKIRLKCMPQNVEWYSNWGDFRCNTY